MCVCVCAAHQLLTVIPFAPLPNHNFSVPLAGPASPCSLEEFTSLMQGRSWVHEGEEEVHATFELFGAESINFRLLSLMVQVCPRMLASQKRVHYAD